MKVLLSVSPVGGSAITPFLRHHSPPEGDRKELHRLIQGLFITLLGSDVKIDLKWVIPSDYADRINPRVFE